MSCIIAATAGVVFWYDTCRVYWHKDLMPPLDSPFFLVLIVGFALLIVAVLFQVFKASSFTRKSTLATPSLTLAAALPLLNFFISLTDFLLDGTMPQIYYFAADGIAILIQDSLILAFAGVLTGILLTAILNLCRRFPFRVPHQASDR